MAEYIEREALVDLLEILAKYENGERQQCIIGLCTTIRKRPTADVVEVVRCKDCRHKNELNKYEKTLYADGCVACSFISATGDRLVMLGDAFCNYGEKMDGKGEG